MCILGVGVVTFIPLLVGVANICRPGAHFIEHSEGE